MPRNIKRKKKSNPYKMRFHIMISKKKTLIAYNSRWWEKPGVKPIDILKVWIVSYRLIIPSDIQVDAFHLFFPKGYMTTDVMYQTFWDRVCEGLGIKSRPTRKEISKIIGVNI